jgi:hypothetical protein
MRWAGHVARMGDKRNAYRLLVGKPEGRRSLGRPRRRCLDNIRMDLVKVWWGYVDWIGLAQDRGRRGALVNSVMNLQVPCNAGKLSSVRTTTDLSSSAQLHRVSNIKSVSELYGQRFCVFIMTSLDRFRWWHSFSESYAPEKKFFHSVFCIVLAGLRDGIHFVAKGTFLALLEIKPQVASLMNEI